VGGSGKTERIGFKMIAITADGASQNQKFFRMHSPPNDQDLCYTTPVRTEKYISLQTSLEDHKELLVPLQCEWHLKSLGAICCHRLMDMTYFGNSCGSCMMSLLCRSEGLFMLKKLSKEHLNLTNK
jgi:hypothetical protein